ncbi:MAG: hypothetical protein GKR90_24540 [Pseudomonadales bacterium]|nr:hypothetical protein [Pseudomonadales bacterium]
MATPYIGHRILVWGNSCSGKSSLAELLATTIEAPFVELDALNWLPNWVGLNTTDPDRLLRRIEEATGGDAWVVAGSYSEQSQVAFWPNLETIVWLDLPRHLLIRRCLKRSFLRWWRKELLWGTNYESFVKQLQFWRGEESLLWWVWTQHANKRADSIRYMTDPSWQHIRWIHLRSEIDVDRFCQTVRATASVS